MALDVRAADSVSARCHENKRLSSRFFLVHVIIVSASEDSFELLRYGAVHRGLLYRVRGRCRERRRSFASVTIRYMKAYLIVVLWVFPLAAGAEVYRCGNSYSSSPCSGARRVDVAPAVSAGPNSSTVSIHLCKAYSGSGRFWTSGRCSDHNGTIDRVVNVPRGMSWEHQVEIANDAVRTGDALANPPALRRSAPVVQDGSAQRCQYLAGRIEWLDGAARAGGVASYMDWLSEERRRARDEQFRLRCR